ncbi:glutamyl-tRNA reductase [Halohasta litorea]|uniref:Glutamyl-tRNA reductase n=1 Tax=Halohasta litorea TaxID=869891 RepID=A0ABD6DCY1_9EURY|nr:glutamyl-tRNA reductase [Halohasta litorea]MEA1931979.1 glutamyl-tRNA reductase [Euryarchaeota archaeon]
MDHQQTAVGEGDGAVDPEAVKQSIRAHGERIKQQELQQAMNRLEAHGTLTAEQRRIVDEMATAILDEILSSPESVLEADDHDPETVRTAVDLFDPKA